MKKIITPREPMPIKILKWCIKAGVCDVCTYDNAKESLDRRWEVEFRTDKVVSLDGLDFCKCFTDGREVVDSLTKQLGATTVIGMTAEGALNYALHYGTDYKLRDRFTKFLDRYGYKWHCISNCYYLVYKV